MYTLLGMWMEDILDSDTAHMPRCWDRRMSVKRLAKIIYFLSWRSSYWTTSRKNWGGGRGDGKESDEDNDGKWGRVGGCGGGLGVGGRRTRRPKQWRRRRKLHQHRRTSTSWKEWRKRLQLQESDLDPEVDGRFLGLLFVNKYIETEWAQYVLIYMEWYNP